MNSRSLITCFVLSIALMASGCSSLTQTARKRGAYDLKCPEEQVTVKNIPGGSLAVEGCGKTNTYKCWHTGLEPQCIQEKDIPQR